MNHTITAAELAQLRDAIYNAISDDQPYIVKCKAALTLLSEIAARTQEPVAECIIFPLQGNEAIPTHRIIWRNGPVAGELFSTPQPAAVPDGMVPVPVEPTDEMLDAASNLGFFREYAIRLYKAMLAAAPKEAT